MTTPEKAAEIIMRGVHDKKRRVMVGVDSQLIQLTQRLFPETYAEVFSTVERRLG
jgi:short-subunit dehydrogenase